jgi:hypothetical protein
MTQTPWDDAKDVEVLCGVAQHDGALRVLHRRYAPHLHALAKRDHLGRPDLRVQDALLALTRQARCYARTDLDARTWILVIATHVMTRPGGYR